MSHTTTRRRPSQRNRQPHCFEWLEDRCLLSADPLSPALVIQPLPSVHMSGTTEHKPQSKVWTYDGKWWAALASTTGTWVWRLDELEWKPVLQLASGQYLADVKSAGNVAHILLYNDLDGTTSKLASVEYVPATANTAGTYKFWSRRPSLADLTFSPGVETATIDIDSTGRMWAASDAETTVEVRYSDAPYATWSSPITIASGISLDDISVVTALPNRTTGVLWANQTTQRFGFRTHLDGTSPNTWTPDEVPSPQTASTCDGGAMADDHLNLAVASDSTLYAAVKTSFNSPGCTVIGLLVRRPNGAWDPMYTVDTSAGAATRPIVLLNESLGRLVVMYGDFSKILYRESATSPIAFTDKASILPANNVTSTKQNWTNEVVAIAGGTAVKLTVPPNQAPTNIVLSPSTVPENSPNGTVVGQLSTTDPDAGDTHTYSLALSAGGRFALSGNQLIVANGSLLDAETSCSHAVFVRSTDQGGLSVQKTLSIKVTGVDEFAPSGIGLSAASVSEGAATGTLVGELSSTDPDTCETQTRTYTLLDDAGERFRISGNRLVVDQGSLLNRQTSTTHTITVQVADSGGLTFEQDFTIAVTEPDPNQPPQVDAGADQTVTVSGVAKLAAKVTDDGLPNPPGKVTTTWVQVSGPGTVTFAKASAAGTDATFSAAGTYVLRLEANDGSLTTGDNLMVTVTAGSPGPTNQAPQVNAGADQTVRFNKSASLSGKVKDDRLPKPPAKFTTTWTKVSGPGEVTFAKSSSALTTATFGAEGTYVLRLEANDGALMAGDEVRITVTPPPVNQAPQVNAGADQTIAAGKSAKVAGKVKDDGLPRPPGKLTSLWTKVSGPGTVSFQKAASASTTASFGQPGTYVLRLQASDGLLKSTDDVTITVSPAKPLVAAMLGVRPRPSSNDIDKLLAGRDITDLLVGF